MLHGETRTALLVWLIAVFTFSPSGRAQSTALPPAALTGAPVSSAELIKRAAQFIDAGNYRYAVGDLNRALRADPSNVEALALRGKAYTKLQESDKAIADLSAVIARAPQNADYYAARADAYDSAGRLSDAKADREHAKQLLSPGEAAKPVEKATAAVEAAPPPPPPSTTTPTQPAPAFSPAPSPVAAGVAVPAPAATSPTPPARVSTGVLPVGEPNVSAPATNTAPPAGRERGPSVARRKVPETAARNESAEAHNQRGRELEKMGKYREALVELDFAVNAKPDSPQYLNARGFAYFMLHDTRHALADLDEAIRLSPNYVNAYRNRAAARKLAGDKTGSESDLAKTKALEH